MRCLQIQAVTSMQSTGEFICCAVLAIELMFFRLGWSAVHWAAGGGHTHCIEALAKAGADVSVVARSSM